MARKTTVVLEDDLCGGPAERTIRFGLDGVSYDIDLSAQNAAAFRDQLAPFMEYGRIARRRRQSRTAASRHRSASIRAWAQENGIALHQRGRIPASVVEQYQAATVPKPGNASRAQ